MDEWDTDCETALEDLCIEIANGDEARVLKAILPALREHLNIARKYGHREGLMEASAACESAKPDAVTPTQGQNHDRGKRQEQNGNIKACEALGGR